MRNYPHIISKVYRQPWAILQERFLAIERALESRLAGETAAAVATDDDVDEKPEPEKDGKTAIIPIHGIIGKHLSNFEMMCGGCSLDMVDQWLKVATGAETNRVILDIRSPGGTVTGVPETARRIAALADEKEVIAFSDSEMCSAAYWLASQAREIIVTESAAIGSIGVYMALLDKTRMLDDAGVKVNAISAGKYKLMGASFKPLTDEERTILQAEVDKCYEAFKESVTRTRAVEDHDMQGQLFDGAQAVEVHLADDMVESIDDVIYRKPRDD